MGADHEVLAKYCMYASSRSSQLMLKVEYPIYNYNTHHAYMAMYINETSHAVIMMTISEFVIWYNIIKWHNHRKKLSLKVQKKMWHTINQCRTSMYGDWYAMDDHPLHDNIYRLIWFFVTNAQPSDSCSFSQYESALKSACEIAT